MSVYTHPEAFDAVRRRDLDALAAACADPQAVRGRDRWEQTPLHWAVRLNVPGAAALLVRQGRADVAAVDRSGNTPLHDALQFHRSLADIRVLLDAGADPAARNKAGAAPVYLALCLGDPNVFAAVAERAAPDAVVAADGRTLRTCVQQQRPTWTPMLSGNNADGVAPATIPRPAPRTTTTVAPDRVRRPG